MDKLDEVRSLREEYEAALDGAEARRAAYHRAVVKLHLAGMPLREIADGLGLSHQRVHQIVTGEQPPARKRKGRPAKGAIAAFLLLSASTAGLVAGLRIQSSSEPPLPPGIVSMPRLVGLPFDRAQETLERSGMCLQRVSGTQDETLPESTVGSQSPSAGKLVPRGSAADLSLAPGKPVTVQLSVTCSADLQVFGTTIRPSRMFKRVPSAGTLSMLPGGRGDVVITFAERPDPRGGSSSGTSSAWVISPSA